MADFSDKEGGFGLMRALSRVRAPGRKAPQIGEPAGLKSPEAPSSENLHRSREMASAQKNLKSKTEARQQHDGLELWPLPGLAPMTRVRTSFGDVHSIALRKGDKVLLKSGEYKPIRWINRIMLDEHILALKPDSNPILLGAGSLAPGVPQAEMMVSPRQIFCADERSGLNKPREAAMLLSRTGVRRFRETGLTYTMFHVGEAADVYCEGLFLRFPIEA
jgi:hypothetical protein